MADETDDATEDGGKKRDPKMLVIGLVLVLGAGWFFFLRPAPVDEDAAAETEAAAEEAEPTEGEIVPVEVMTVNLTSEDLSFARVGSAIVLTPETTADMAAPRMALYVDRAITAIAGWEPDALRQPSGHDQLREQLTTAALEVWSEDEVMRVVLTELLVQ